MEPIVESEYTREMCIRDIEFLESIGDHEHADAARTLLAKWDKPKAALVSRRNESWKSGERR